MIIEAVMVLGGGFLAFMCVMLGIAFHGACQEYNRAKRRQKALTLYHALQSENRLAEWCEMEERK